MKERVDNKLVIFYCMIFVVFTSICFFVFLNYGYPIIRILRYLFLINMLILLAYIDYKKTIIPNKILLIMLGVRLGFLAIECVFYKDLIYSIMLSAFLGLTIGSGVFLLASFIIKNSLGMGDVKLMGVIGFFVGITDLFSCMLLSLIISLAVGVTLIIVKKITSKDFIPFAPFLALGTIITLIFKL